MIEVAAIVLAAGEGRRFRALAPDAPSKLTALWRGRALVAYAVAAARAAGLPTIVVTGHAEAAVAAALAGETVEWRHNSGYAEGMAGSLRVGLKALAPTAEAAVVLLADMPQIGAPLILALVEAFRAAPPGTMAVVPVKDGRRGNPVLLARALFPEAMRFTGDEGARRLLAAHGARVVEMATDDPTIFLDVDTPDALPPA